MCELDLRLYISLPSTKISKKLRRKTHFLPYVQIHCTPAIKSHASHPAISRPRVRSPLWKKINQSTEKSLSCERILSLFLSAHPADKNASCLKHRVRTRIFSIRARIICIPHIQKVFNTRVYHTRARRRSRDLQSRVHREQREREERERERDRTTWKTRKGR